MYALMVYFIIGFLFPGSSSPAVAFTSVTVCFLIEISQLYQAEWINEIRRTRLGGLILGFGFLWRDLISYIAGGMVGMTIEYVIQKMGR